MTSPSPGNRMHGCDKVFQTVVVIIRGNYRLIGNIFYIQHFARTLNVEYR